MKKSRILLILLALVLGVSLTISGPVLAKTAKNIFSQKVVFKKVVDLRSGIKNKKGAVKVKDNLRVTGTIRGDVYYDNSDSGLDADTMQEAIDSLAVTLADTIQEGLTSQATRSIAATVPLGTSWTGTVYDVWEGTLRETTELDGTEIEVTFTPTAANAGTFSSTALNIFYPYEQIDQGKHIGTITGSYKIVGDTFLITDVSDTDLTTGLTAEATILPDKSIIFEETRVTPNAVIVLTPIN